MAENPSAPQAKANALRQTRRKAALHGLRVLPQSGLAPDTFISLTAGMAGLGKYALPGASCYMLRGDGLERQAPQERARGVKNHIEPLQRHYGFPDGLHLHGVMIALFLVVNAQ